MEKGKMLKGSWLFEETRKNYDLLRDGLSVHAEDKHEIRLIWLAITTRAAEHKESSSKTKKNESKRRRRKRQTVAINIPLTQFKQQFFYTKKICFVCNAVCTDLLLMLCRCCSACLECLREACLCNSNRHNLSVWISVSLPLESHSLFCMCLFISRLFF